MIIKRSVLFSCFALSGISLDGYWTWYSYHFAAACSDSGNSISATWFLFAALSLIPASASLIFRSDRIYVVICVVIWLLYIVLQIYLITDDRRFEGIAGVNCYRDVGTGSAVSFAFTIFFSVIIIAITLAFGAVQLVQKWLKRVEAKRRRLVSCVGRVLVNPPFHARWRVKENPPCANRTMD